MKPYEFVRNIGKGNEEVKLTSDVHNRSPYLLIELPVVYITVSVVFNNFLLIDATDISKIRKDQHRIFFDVNLYPL